MLGYSVLILLLAGVALGLIVLLLANLWRFRLSQICYAVRTSHFVHAPQPTQDLSITYKGQSVSSLYFTDVIIWNRGWQVVQSADIVESFNLEIPDGIEIIEQFVTERVGVDSQSISVGDPQVDQSGQTAIPIRIAALRPKSAIKLRIVYTGEAREKFELTGALNKIPTLPLYVSQERILEPASAVFGRYLLTFLLSGILLLPVIFFILLDLVRRHAYGKPTQFWSFMFHNYTWVNAPLSFDES